MRNDLVLTEAEAKKVTRIDAIVNDIKKALTKAESEKIDIICDYDFFDSTHNKHKRESADYEYIHIFIKNSNYVNLFQIYAKASKVCCVYSNRLFTLDTLTEITKDIKDSVALAKDSTLNRVELLNRDDVKTLVKKSINAYFKAETKAMKKTSTTKKAVKKEA